MNSVDTENLLFPNVTLAHRIRNAIRSRLRLSLHHLVFDFLGQSFEPPLSEDELRLMVLERNEYPKAPVFALHAELLAAALEEDFSPVPQLFEMLGNMVHRQASPPSDWRITPLCEPQLHADDVILLQRAFADDVGLTSALVRPSDDSVKHATQLINDALAGLDQAAPSWGEELRLFTNQVYLATAGETEAQPFDGAAVFDAFGGMLLNPLSLRNQGHTLIALIHESSHQQLFMFHVEDPVVLNDAEAAYSSPLRAEPRPMEGIFHAMWVSARMVLAADAVASSAAKPAWADQLTEHRSRALQAFRDCAVTVAAHADLTEFGVKLFSSAQEAIDGV